MSDYEHKEVSAPVSFYGTSIPDILFGKYPKDIKPGGKKTGKMRKALRKSLMFRYRRGAELDLKRSASYRMKFTPRISLHKRRKQSRGFVSNRKSGV